MQIILNLIDQLFCIEKVYYFYCDKLNREKIPSGNIVKYLLEQVTARIENSKNSKSNNYDKKINTNLIILIIGSIAIVLVLLYILYLYYFRLLNIFLERWNNQL